MKKVHLFIAILFTTLLACQENKKYCGKIIDKGYDQPSSGYKTHTDPVYYIIMNVDSINLAIRINLTIPAYYSYSVGDRACFDLNEGELSSYGNGATHLIK